MDNTKGETLDQLEKKTAAQGSQAAPGSNIVLGGEKDDRFRHVDYDDERVLQFGDRKFEKIMMAIGVAIVLTMFVLISLFYSTIEVRDIEDNSISAQVESSFFGRFITDKDYVITYRINGQLYEYDPLENSVDENASPQGVGPVSSKSSGGYRVNPADSSAIIDSSGREIISLGDPAVAIDTVLVAPDGNSVIFDTHPANTQEAQAKYGLRVGAYEVHLEDSRFDVLVSDASPGIEDPTYKEHFVEILSISPNGRYLAYTNRNKLRLYDRLSGASVVIDDLPYASYLPDTGWTERATPTDASWQPPLIGVSYFTHLKNPFPTKEKEQRSLLA